MKRSRLAAQLWLSMQAAAMLAACAGCSKESSPDTPRALEVDVRARTVSLPATVAKQETYKELKGAIEYVLVGKGGKVYETVFTTDCAVEEIHQALVKIGLRPGLPTDGERPPRGMPVYLFVEYESGGKSLRRPLDEFVLRVRPAEQSPGAAAAGAAATRPAPPPAPPEPARPLQPEPWTFTGSSVVQDPATQKPMLQASLTESIIALHLADSSALLANSRPESRLENIYRANTAALPPPGTPVRILFRRLRANVPEGTRRVHLLAGGRLQTVGYATYAAGQARRLNVNGFIRNLRDGRVEAVLEGPAPAVGELLETMRRRPLGARVEEFHVTEETPEGDFQTFETWH